MLIQYHKISNNDPNRIQLLSMIFCEIILLIFELFEFAAIIFNMSRYQFHFNLKVVVGYAIFAYWFDIIARITIAFFEIGLFNLGKNEFLFNSKNSLERNTTFRFLQKKIRLCY